MELPLVLLFWAFTSGLISALLIGTLKIGQTVGLYIFSGLHFITQLGLLITCFSLLILTGSLPFNVVYGFNYVYVFTLSLICWTSSFYMGFITNLKYYNTASAFIPLLYLFDVFVFILRPLTLTLRIVINVSLGHFLIEGVFIGAWVTLPLIWAFELFVYVVQTYVFLVLLESYLWAPSLVFSTSHLRWEG